MQLRGDSFLLRPFRVQDKQAMAKHANNRKIAYHLRDVFPYPYSEQDAEQFISFVLKHNGPLTNFIIEADGEAIGTIGILLKADVYRKNAEIGYWLSEDYWGKGIITEAIKLTVSYVFSHFDVVRIYATPFANNTGSIRALEKAGFSREATLHKSVFKNGQFLNEYVYTIYKS